MQIDWTHFSPGHAVSGGLLIGAAAGMLVLFNGRIAGISGIVARLLRPVRGDTAWRAAFVLGMLSAAWLARMTGVAPAIRVDAGWPVVLIAGFVVGIATRLAGGCTSGHGVCGMARGSTRSLVATLVFMLTGIATVFAIRHLSGA